MLARLAAFVHDHRRRVLVVAVIAFVFAGALGGGVAKRLDPYGAVDPATDSYHADKLIERSGVQGAPGLIALVRGSGPVASSATRAKVAAVAHVLRADPAVGSVTTFFDSHDRAMISRDRHSTYVATRFKPLADKSLERAAKRLDSRLGHMPGVTLGGYGIAFVQVNRQVESDLIRAEMFAFPLLLLLSLLFFRSLVAAALPLLVGGLAIVGTFLALRLYSEVTSVSVFALNLTTGLGLGLAIDYSLFIVSRYREELATGLDPRAALVRTLETAGRTVLFSSLTVAAALASLLVFPQRFLYSMGLGGATVALIAATVALVVLPAVLAALGPRVNALAPARLQRAATRDAQPDEAGAWYRLSRFVMRRAAPVAVASAALLIALGIPFLSARFTSVDASVLPTSATARQVDAALRAEFPPHRDSPITVAVDTSGAGSPAATRGALASLRSTASRLPGVVSVAAAEAVDPGDRAGVRHRERSEAIKEYCETTSWIASSLRSSQ